METNEIPKTVPLSSDNNVATFYMAPTFREFEAYEVKAGFKDSKQLIVTEPVNIIEDDEGNVPFILHPNPWKEGDITKLEGGNNKVEGDNMSKPCHTCMIVPETKPLGYNIPIVEADTDEKSGSDEELLMQYHHAFGHISFQRLRDMARVGIIPKRLYNCRIPMCSACMYAKATRTPWRNKPRKD